MVVHTQSAYILHKRAFRETSQILEVFTRDHGRLSLMSRGSRSPKSKINGVLQLFQPLVISWQGRGDMPYLRSVEPADGGAPRLKRRALISAIYINELLINLIHKNDVHQKVYDLYHEALFSLQSDEDIELTLRLLEKNLLNDLGFGLNLETDADSGERVIPGEIYAYHFEHGPVRSRSGKESSLPIVTGDSLISFSQDRLTTNKQMNEIKTLMRFILSNHLGLKKLKTRELFRRSSAGTIKT